jgi:hypothetical protein
MDMSVILLTYWAIAIVRQCRTILPLGHARHPNRPTCWTINYRAGVGPLLGFRHFPRAARYTPPSRVGTMRPCTRYTGYGLP